MSVHAYPHRIAQGGRVTLKATPPNEDSGANWQYYWNFFEISDTQITPTPPLPPYQDLVHVDTTGLTPGAYRVHCTIIDGSSPPSSSPPGGIPDEVFFTVDPSPLTEPLGISIVRRFPDEGESEHNLALWQTIRVQTEAIKFQPYQAYINTILCQIPSPLTSSPTDGSTSPPQLVSPRELIVNGVDAYKILRAATEAFLIHEIGVFKDPKNEKLNVEVPEEFSRLGKVVTYRDIRDGLRTYLGDIGLPILDRIVRALGSLPVDGKRPGGVSLDKYPECAYPILPENGNRLIFDDGFRHPLILELIWNYWHEEGMLVQTVNAITLRFQNRRGAGEHDPLAHLELDPLRPLNNMLWGYLQEEYRRLTVQRRAYEYDHHYGLSLLGKAIPTPRTADTRSRFLEAFHNLLNLCTVFYKQADDTTVTADPFPLLNALKEVHLILAEGAHNQFGDLPWTARVEMLIQQWLLARPEMNEYLRGRAMVPYEEDWMGRVDTMKTLQGWTDTTITHFHNLGVFGEQLLLSIRFTDWVGINLPGPAGAWALYWRPEIQGYIHAYRAVTGVELAVDKTSGQPAELLATRPSELLRRRLVSARNGRDGRMNGRAVSPAQVGQEKTTSDGQKPGYQTFRERRAERK